MKPRILVLSSEAVQRASLAQMLIRGGYAVELAESVKLARRLMDSRDVSLAIVAPSELGTTCLEFVQELAEATCPTLIVIDGHKAIDPLTKTIVTTSGGDAHVQVTLDEREILTRVRGAFTRPSDGGDAPGRARESLQFDGLTLDLSGHTLRGRLGQEVALTHAEFTLLATLASYPCRVLSRAFLGDAIPGHTADADDRSIDVMIWRLRRKIEVDPKAPRLVVTVPGAGYKLAAAVRLISAGASETAEPLQRKTRAEWALAVERRHLTIVSCDLADWAQLSARRDPEDAHGILLAFRSCCSEAVTRYGGIVAAFSGCEMQAYFGYPQAHEHDAERAVRAALVVIEAVTKLGSESAAALGARIGIATGPVVTSEPVAAGAAQAPAVAGPAPLLAERFRRAAAPGTVLIGVDTRALIGGLFQYRELGSIASVDALGPMSSWQVVGEGRADSRFQAIHRDRPKPPLVGRDEEGDLLLRRWQQSITGEGRVVLIGGEAGIGKSRLAAGLAESLATEAHTRLRFQCSPDHAGSPLHPVTARLRRTAGIAADQPVDQQLKRLERALAVGTSDPTAVAPLFANLLSIPAGHRYAPLALGPADQRRATFAALIDQLEGLARRKPLLLLFEDVHWADATSLELLDLTIGIIPRLPILAVVTFRPQFAPPWTGLANVSGLTLGRLEPRYARMIAEGVAGEAKLPSEVIEQIVARADGIPLFVEELTKLAIESTQLAGGTKEDAGHAPPAAPIPASLQSSLMARLDRRASAKAVAQVGAVIGRRFSHALLHGVVALEPAALGAALDELEQSGLVFCRGMPPDATYNFAHALVRDAAYDSLGRGRRQAVHRQVAEALRDKFPALAETEPELVAWHFTQADVNDAALQWWARAGRHALSRSAYVEAIADFGKALELAERSAVGEEQRLSRLRLQIDYANALIAARGHGAPETTAAFARARELAGDIEDCADRLSAYYGLWVGSFVRAELEPLREIAAAFARETQGQPGSPEAGVAHRAVGVTAWFEGDYLRARESLEAAFAAHDSTRDRDLATRFGQDSGVASAIYLALVLWPLGRAQHACNLIETAHDLALRSAHVPTVVFSHSHAALFACLRGDTAEASRHAEAALQLSRKHGLPMWLANGTFCSGWARWRNGDKAAGLAAMKEGIALLRSLEAYLPFYAGLLAYAEGGEAGIAGLTRHIDKAEQSGQRWFEAELHRLHGELLLQREPAAAAAAEIALTRSLAIARHQGTKAFELRAALSLTKLYQSTGRDEAGRRLLEPIHRELINESELQDVQKAKSLLSVAERVPSQA